mgnify:CR=1 FL=1
MGGTYDGVSSVDRSAEYGLSGSGTVGRDGSAHARCWVLRDRVLLLLFGVGVVADSLGPFFGVSRVGDVRGGTARTLRTTQWTRAS